MSRLIQLQRASSLHDLAAVLGYSAKGLAFIVFGTPDASKYEEFTIPKRSGGKRTISAPSKELKRLQKHLAKLLQDCIIESDNNRKIKNSLSHGFRPKHSIMTNAVQHRKHRYVFNIDLQDFFGAINFGRVWRFLEKNREFKLNSVVARIISQIACHNRSLPQGSPCSPVLSNLVAHILDIRMAQLAAQSKCHYSRYADDLTFSTNEQSFSSLIATRNGDSKEWTIATPLAREIARCGFNINPAKTRMQFKSRRQDVTGIVVNSKLNVRSEYSHNVRAMVNSLITKGEFEIKKMYRDEIGAWQTKTEKGTRSQLRGMLSFIDSVRTFDKNKGAIEKHSGETQSPQINVEKMDKYERSYRKFLLYTQFFQPELPLLICEGKTDNVYIRCALRKLAEKFPDLVVKKEKILEFKINFYKHSKINSRILHLGGGTGDMGNFLARYGTEFDGFKADAKRCPIIVLVDNDSGSNQIFATIKKITKSSIPIDGGEPYYHIRDNLYVVAIPKLDGKETAIEHFFEKKVLATKLGVKVFSGTDKFDAATQYGKHLFAEHVVKKNRDEINFSGFESILSRIQAVLDAHSKV